MKRKGLNQESLERDETLNGVDETVRYLEGNDVVEAGSLVNNQNDNYD